MQTLKLDLYWQSGLIYTQTGGSQAINKGSHIKYQNYTCLAQLKMLSPIYVHSSVHPT